MRKTWSRFIWEIVVFIEMAKLNCFHFNSRITTTSLFVQRTIISIFYLLSPTTVRIFLRKSETQLYRLYYYHNPILFSVVQLDYKCTQTLKYESNNKIMLIKYTNLFARQNRAGNYANLRFVCKFRLIFGCLSSCLDFVTCSVVKCSSSRRSREKVVDLW